MTCYHADEITLRNIAFHIKKKQAIPGFTSTFPRKSRERGAKAYLRMERPRSKPSSKVESHPQNCSAGNQKTSQKYGRSVGSLRDIEEKDDALWYMADGMRRTNL